MLWSGVPDTMAFQNEIAGLMVTKLITVFDHYRSLDKAEEALKA